MIILTFLARNLRRRQKKYEIKYKFYSLFWFNSVGLRKLLQIKQQFCIKVRSTFTVLGRKNSVSSYNFISIDMQFVSKVKCKNAIN